MRATAMKEDESGNAKEYTLTFPKERHGTMREWVCLMLFRVGYETLDIDTYCFGRFPPKIRVRPRHEETEEMRIVLKKYLVANGVKIEG